MAGFSLGRWDWAEWPRGCGEAERTLPGTGAECSSFRGPEASLCLNIVSLSQQCLL